jgi:transcriptional regulator with XRE-family HTH domain
MAVKKKQHHKVLKNNDAVRKIIDLYVDLFKNYQQAAEAIGINKDTIAQYKTHRTNISLTIFEKIAEVVYQNYTPIQIEDYTGGLSLRDIKGQSQTRNGAQIDHVMYVINDNVYAILKLYCNHRESYAEAAKSLDINPRTFKAYLLRQTSALPRRYFWEIINNLKNYGYTSPKLFQLVGAKRWQEFIQEKRRSATICHDKTALKEELISRFEKGRIRQRDISTSLHNASKRLYGSLGRAIRETMKDLSKKLFLKAKEYLSINDLDRAMETIQEFSRYIELYEENEKAVNKALPKNRKIKWEPLVQGYRDLSAQLTEQLNEKKNEINRRTLKDLDGILDEDNESSSLNLRNYSLDEHYTKGEFVNHPAYGAGKVIRTFGDRHMVVQFGKRYGKKILIMNDKNPRPEFKNLFVDA